MMQPEIVQVIPTENYTVYLYYSDGNVREYNARPLIQKGGVFEKLKHLNMFINTCTIMNGTLAWDIGGDHNEWKCIDICPDTLYKCPIVKNIDEIEKQYFADAHL